MASSNRSQLPKKYQELRALVKSAITPFGPASEEEKNQRKEKARKNLKFFAATYFPHHLTVKPSAMHEELYRRYQGAVHRAEKTGEGARMAYAAPRGNAKSTLSSLILPLWCIAGNKRRFIGLLSDTSEQAEELLEGIKAELEANERLREDFPEICLEGPTWKIGKIQTANGIKITCWGKRKRLRGARFGSKRPDLIICDDLENDENIDAPEQREKDRKWFFKAVMKIGARDTVTIVIGTILHYDSLLSRLLKTPWWTVKKWQSVIRGSRSHLWEQWESLFTNREKGMIAQADLFFNEHERAMLRGTRVLWPELEDYYYLMKMRVSDGPAYFDSEKQNDPVNPDDCLFQEDWFRFWDEPEAGRQEGPFGILPEEAVYAAVDPSMGGFSRNADPSAIVIAVVRENGWIDILEADICKRHPDAIMETLFAYHQKYQFAKVVVEEVQFQELFKDQLIKEGAKRNIYLPVEGVRPTGDKILRVSKLQPHIKNGLIRFRRNQTILLDQLKYFPKADHDDGPDALEMLFTLIQKGSQGPRIRRLA